MIQSCKFVRITVELAPKLGSEVELESVAEVVSPESILRPGSDLGGGRMSRRLLKPSNRIASRSNEGPASVLAPTPDPASVIPVGPFALPILFTIPADLDVVVLTLEEEALVFVNENLVLLGLKLDNRFSRSLICCPRQHIPFQY
jgi:hypothetical protein